MSSASRNLQVGDRVTTDFSGNITEHYIVERVVRIWYQGGVGLLVRPTVPKSTGEPMSIDWFEPAAVQEGSESNG